MSKRRRIGETPFAREAKRFVEGLKTRHGFDIACDPKRARGEIIQAINAAIPLERGRPRDGSITVAERMRSGGQSWDEVTAFLYPAYRTANKFERSYWKSKAMTAIKQRRRRDEARRKEREGNHQA